MAITSPEDRSIGFTPGTFIRRESFGAILFNKYDGRMIEVDDCGYDLLVQMDGLKTIREIISDYLKGKNVRDVEVSRKIESFLHFLRLQRIICYDGSRAAVKPARANAGALRKLQAPEIVHFSITDRCNTACTCCYKNPISRNELDEIHLMSIIDECIRLGVLQLSFGGGEPLLRINTLLKLISSASGHMRVSVTTNGTLIDHSTAKALYDSGLDHLQVSLNGPGHVHTRVTGTDDYDRRISGIKIAAECGLFAGVNCIVTEELLPMLNDFVSDLAGIGIRHVNFIRPKRNEHNDEWYTSFGLKPSSFKSLQDIFSRLKSDHPGISFTHDCSFVQIYKRQKPGRLLEKGVFGCTAWKRICYVSQTLDVYGCSHYIGTLQPAGNLGSQPLDSIWNNASKRQNINPHCTGCGINDICIPCVNIPEKEVVYCEKQ